MELSLLTHRAGQISNEMSSSNRSLDQQIRLLRDIQFTCPTNITNVLLGINVLTVTDTCNQYPSILLVERKREQGQSQDDFTYMVLAEQTVYYTTENVTTNGIYNYSLNPPIAVTPPNISANGNIENKNVLNILGIKILDDGAVTVYYDVLTTSNPYTTKRVDGDFSGSNTSITITDQLVLVYPLAGKIHINVVNIICLSR